MTEFWITLPDPTPAKPSRTTTFSGLVHRGEAMKPPAIRADTLEDHDSLVKLVRIAMEKVKRGWGF